MNITKGFWKTIEGYKAEVLSVRRYAIGWIETEPYYWFIKSGICVTRPGNQLSLVEPWSDKHEWKWNWDATPRFNYLAMDEDGIWRLYESRPVCKSKMWVAFAVGTAIPAAYYPKYTGDWKDSLICRPEITK